MKRYLKEGEMIPFFYAPIGYDPSMMMTAVAPIHINYLYRFWWSAVRKYRPSKWDEQVRKAVRKAEIDGRAKGYDDAHGDLKLFIKTINAPK